MEKDLEERVIKKQLDIEIGKIKKKLLDRANCEYELNGEGMEKDLELEVIKLTKKIEGIEETLKIMNKTSKIQSSSIRYLTTGIIIMNLAIIIKKI